MTNRTLQVDEPLYDYLLKVSLHEDDVLQALRAETMQMEMARMQIAPEQGQFMALLLQLIGARRYLEVGTFTGYSALACAMALPADGEVYALDVNREWTSVAERYWAQAGCRDRITLLLGSAQESLAGLVTEQAATFDAVFIDADKTAYATYIQYASELLRPGGLLMLDNVLWGGAVVDPDAEDEDTIAIRRVNEAMYADPRWDLSLVPIGDGLTLARKR